MNRLRFLPRRWVPATFWRFALMTGMLIAPVEFSFAQEPSSSSQPSVMTPDIPADHAEPPIRSSISLRGSVWRTKAGIVFLKTPIGLVTLSSKTTLKDLKASHDVQFSVHEENAVVEVRRKGDGSLVHRYLTGPMTLDPEAPKTLRWWTPEGEEAARMGAHEDRLNSFHEGDLLTVEVDEARTIVGVHDLQYDIQISQTPPAGAQAQVLLSGTVSKVKSNFIFFRTPVGVVMVNSKIGVPPVKVGQPMTLHIDGSHITVDLNAAAKPARQESVPSPTLAPAP